MEPLDHFREKPGMISPNSAEPHVFASAASFDPMFTWEQALRVLKLRKKLIFVLAGTLSFAIIAVALLLKNTYQPTSRIEIDPLETGIKTLQEIESSNGAPDQDYLETQVQILQSEALAMRVIRALHLDTNYEFVSRADIIKFGNAPKDLQASLVSDDRGDFLREQMELANRSTLEAITLKSFQQRLSVSPIRNSRLIEVSFASHDPQLARLVTNSLVTEFIDQNYKTRYSSTMESSGWLSTQLNTLRKNVEESTRAVANFETQYGLVESDDHDLPMSQLMAEENHQLSDAQANRIEAEAYARMIDAGQSDSLPALHDDQVYQNLLTRYADIRSQLAQARTIYGDENLNVKKLESESAEMASQVESERARVVNRSLANFEAAKSREKMVLQSRDKLRTQMGAASSHLMQHQLLKSEALANGELYNTLRGRLSEAGIYAGLRSSNIHIVDLAPKLITASGPHRLFIIVTGTFASCLFSIALAFVMEGFENKVRTAEDIRNWAGLRSLAMIPTIEVVGKNENKNRLKGFQTEVHAPGPSFLGNAPLAQSEAIRSLRTSLLLSGGGSPPRVILISSAMMGEGKTTLSVNLATALAQGGRKCLLIDADLRRPRIAKIFGVGPGTGLADVLNESAEFEDALTPAPNVPGLSLITSGKTDSDPTDMLRPERMRLILEKAKYEFDFVLIDSPPVIPFSDARLLALMAEVVILVGRYGFTTRRALGEGAKLFGDAQAPIWGVVLNDINAKSPDFQYNYGYVRGADEDSFRTIYCIPQESSSSDAPLAHGDENDSKSRRPKTNKNDKAKGASA